MDASEAKDFFLDRFAGFERKLEGRANAGNDANAGNEWTRETRRAAAARFGALGFPTTRDEEWKYTSVEPIVKTAFAAGDGAAEDAGDRMADFISGAPAENLFVFVNGRFSQRLSHSEKLPAGTIAGSLAAAMTDHRTEVEPHWARYADYREHGFVALNTALMEDGAFLFVPAGAVVEAPIHFLFLSTAPDEAIVSHPRALIVLEPNSRATVVESYAGFAKQVYFTNAVTEIVLGDGAALDHYKAQLESARAFHVATANAQMGRDAELISYSVALGGALTRNDVNVALDGEGGDCTLNGLYATAGRQHVDNHTRIDHLKPRSTSRELYKGVMGGKSRGVFNGKIYVHPAAEKTDARQTNRNLLLSEEAWIDTKPQLEIYNNDVKCSHGSTIGQLDEEALFYLRARGIGLRDAIGLLIRGFATDVTMRMKCEPVMSWIAVRLEEKLDSISIDEGKR